MIRQTRILAAAIGVAALFAMAAPGGALADGEYWGVDASERSTGGVLSATRGSLTFGAGFTDYGDGVSAGLSLTRRLPFDLGVEGLTLSAGPAIGFGGDDLSDLSLGLTVSAQRFVPTDFGNTFLQASFNTISRSYFLQGQIGFDEPALTVALSHGASTEYEETSLSVSRRLGDSPVSLRAGYRFNADEWFVGFAVNTF